MEKQTQGTLTGTDNDLLKSWPRVELDVEMSVVWERHKQQIKTIGEKTKVSINTARMNDILNTRNCMKYINQQIDRQTDGRMDRLTSMGKTQSMLMRDLTSIKIKLLFLFPTKKNQLQFHSMQCVQPKARSPCLAHIFRSNSAVNMQACFQHQVVIVYWTLVVCPPHIASLLVPAVCRWRYSSRF